MGWKIRISAPKISTPKITIGSKPFARTGNLMMRAPRKLISPDTIRQVKNIRAALALAAPTSLLATAQTTAVLKVPFSRGQNAVGGIFEAPGKGAYDAARFAGASKNTADVASKVIVGGELAAGALIAAPATTTAIVHSAAMQTGVAIKSTATAAVMAAAKKTIGGGPQPIPVKATATNGGVALAANQRRTFIQWLNDTFPSSHSFSKIFGG